MTKKYLLPFTIVLLLLTGCAWMKPHYNDQQMHSYLFNKFDANEDGVITKAEYIEFINELHIFCFSDNTIFICIEFVK